MTNAQGIESFLSLPLETLTILAAGYMGYWIITLGEAERCNAIDTIFTSLIFALLAKLSFDFVIGMETHTVLVAVFTAYLTTIIAAALWRWAGRASILWVLRELDISNSDGKKTT